MTKSASVEIHQINVSQGDCTLVLNRDLAKLRAIVQARANDAIEDDDRILAQTVLDGDPIHYMPFCVYVGLNLKDTVFGALLVDGGNDGYGPDVRAYLQKMGAINLDPLKPNEIYQPRLSLLATHYHDDHQDGLRSVMRDPMPPADLKRARIQARQAGAGFVQTTIEAVRPAAFYRLAPHDKTVNANAFRDRAMGLFPSILAELNAQDGQKTVVIPIPLGGSNGHQRAVISLGTGATGLPIDVIVLGSDQAFSPDGVAVTAIPNKNAQTQKGRPSSENDRSVVLMVQYGAFRHFFGGDIGGATCTIEADVEGALAAALPGMLPRINNYVASKAPAHCCSAKLSHHGSRHSNSDPLLRVLQPKVAVVSSGFRQYFHGHPTKSNVDRMKPGASWAGAPAINTTLSYILATEIASKGKGQAFDPDPDHNVKILGDIVLRPLDETVRARQLSAAVTVQIYGSRDFSGLDPDDTRYALRAGEPASTSENAPFPIHPVYPIAPIEALCDGH